MEVDLAKKSKHSGAIKQVKVAQAALKKVKKHETKAAKKMKMR